MAARHIPYPKAFGSATGPSNNNSSGHRSPITTNSLNDTPRRPSSSLSDLTNLKKRQKDPASRGSSPPDKRVRSGACDTSAANSPTLFVSPAGSRSNSITSLNAGPSSGIHSVRKKPSTDVASPLQRTNSPLSFQLVNARPSRSGDSAPLRTAPTAPSMIPDPTPSTNNPSGAIYSVRTLKARKLAQATQAAQVAAQARSPSNALSDNTSISAIPQAAPTISQDKMLRELKDEMTKMFQNEIESLKTSAHKDLMDEVQRLKKEETEAQEELRKELEDLRFKIKCVQEDEEDTHDKVLDLSDSVESLHKETKTIINDVDDFIGPIEDEHEHTKKTIVQRMCDIEEGYNRLADQLHNLDISGRQVPTVRSDQTKTENSTASSIALLENAQKNTDKTVASFVASLKDTQANIKKDVANALQRVTAVEDKVAANDQRVPPSDINGELESKIKSLDNKIDETLSRISALDAKTTENDGRFSALDAAVQQNASTVLALGDKVKQAESKVSRGDAKVKEAEIKFSTVDAKVKQVESRISTVDTKTARLNGMISTIDIKLREYDSKFSALEADNNKTSSLDSTANAQFFSRLSSLFTTVQENSDKLSSLEASYVDIQKSSSEATEKCRHDVDEIGKQLSVYDVEMSGLQAQLEHAAANSAQKTPSSDAELNQQITDLLTSFHQVKSRVDQLEQTQTQIIEDLKVKHENALAMDTDLKEVENQIHEVTNARRALETALPDIIIRRVISQVETHVEQVVQNLETLNASNNPGSVPAEVKEQIQTLEVLFKDLSSRASNIGTTLRNHAQLINDVSNRATAIDEKSGNSFSLVSNQLREMEQNTTNRLGILTFTVQNFEKRYENISTDKIHQQMVHWITQNYPHAPDFLNQLRALQRQVEKYAVAEGNMTSILASQELQGQRIAKMEEDIKFLTSLPFDQVKQYCGSQPQVFAEIFQLRANIEAINRRLPGGSLRLEWNIDFSKPPYPPHQDEMQG